MTREIWNDPASEANIQHTSNINSWNLNLNQDWCETSGKFLRKWPETRIFTYSGAQSNPKIGPLRPISSTHLKVLVKQYWGKLSENCWRKLPKTLNFNLFGAQNGTKIGLLRPIFHAPLKLLAMSMWSNTDVKPVKKFWDCDISPEFWLTLESKMAPKLGCWGSYGTHLWK